MVMPFMFEQSYGQVMYRDVAQSACNGHICELLQRVQRGRALQKLSVHVDRGSYAASHSTCEAAKAGYRMPAHGGPQDAAARANRLIYKHQNIYNLTLSTQHGKPIKNHFHHFSKDREEEYQNPAETWPIEPKVRIAAREPKKRRKEHVQK